MNSLSSKQKKRKVSADELSTYETVRNLWPYIWPQDRADLKRRVLAAAVALVLAKLITMVVPYLLKLVTDTLAAHDARLGIVVVPVMLVTAYGVGRILMMVFNQIRDALFARVGQHAVRQLAHKTFIHLHHLGLRFHLMRRTGGLSRIIERGVKGIEIIVRFTILSGLPTLLEFALMAIVIAVLFDFFYVLIMAATVWLYVWFTVKQSDWRIKIRREMNESDTDANTKAVDALLNFETVKYFNNEEIEARRFDSSMAKYEVAAVKTWTSLAWLNIGQTVIYSLGMIACMVMSAMAVLDGRQTVGDFVMINAYLIQLSIPLNFIGFVYREIKQGLVDIESMFDLLDVQPEIVDRPHAKPLTITGGDIEFRDVCFSYDKERPILRGISFHVPAGRTVAIVGPSGAGKSTISRLLFRFYDIDNGAILIDGQDIRDVTQENLRQNIGMVPQDTVLFNDTIAYNIRYGRIGASDVEVEQAAALAQIDDFVNRLPEGYQTQVGERGLKLSGGEKQRVAIARTILKAPPILMLDEATSALDTHTERDIQSALDHVSEDRTTLVIAHRLSTVLDADEILVMDQGLIVERGNHSALLEQDGLYASMWHRQREAIEVEEKLRAISEEDKDGTVIRKKKAI